MSITAVDVLRSALHRAYMGDREKYWSVFLKREDFKDAYRVWIGNESAVISGQQLHHFFEFGTFTEGRGLDDLKAELTGGPENPLILQSQVLRDILDKIWPERAEYFYPIYGLRLFKEFPGRDETAILTPGQCGCIVYAIQDFLRAVFVESKTFMEETLSAMSKELLDLIHQKAEK